MTENIVYLEAKIESRLAEFLKLKELLTKLINHPNENIRIRAKVLMDVQEKLESELPQVLQAIENIKSLKIGYGMFLDIAEIGLFYNTMENQIKDVENLAKQGNVQIESGISKWLLYGGIGFISAIIFNYASKRR